MALGLPLHTVLTLSEGRNLNAARARVETSRSCESVAKIRKQTHA